MQVCTKCIYDSSVSGISFNVDGVCNYCDQIEALKTEFATGTPEGEKKLKKILEEIKVEARR